MGLGADQVNDAVFKPSPLAAPFGSGYLLSSARTFGSTPPPHGHVPAPEQSGSILASWVLVRLTMLLPAATYFIIPCRNESVGPSNVSWTFSEVFCAS